MPDIVRRPSRTVLVMSATTPPKGRPTAGRRDRNVAQRRSQSRSSTKKFLWAVLALAVVAAVLVLGSGTGGNANVGGTANTLVPLAFIGLRSWRWTPAPRS